MRLKRAGVGPPRNGVQHGRFNFQKVVRHHVVANAGHGFAAGHKPLTRVFVGHEVHIALAVLQLLVVDPMKLVGQGAQAFSQQAHSLRVHRQLARFGFKQAPLGGHDVAQIPMLKGFVNRFAHFFLLDVDLNPSSAVLQGDEAGLTHDPFEHDATGHFCRNGLGLELFGRLFVIGCQQGCGTVGGLEVVRKNRRALCFGLLTQGLKFVAPLCNQLVVVKSGRSMGFGRTR